jgi:hypothetical protein
VSESPTSPGESPSPGEVSPSFIVCGDICWPAPFICDECCTLDLETVDPVLVGMAEQFAARFLWSATGRIYGGCPRTYRPCRENCPPAVNCCGGYAGSMLQTLPFRAPGSLDWINVPCNRCVKGCQCSAVSEVYIPDVDAVLNVRIDGVDYNPCSMLVVYDRERVVRTDGGQWPACQELGKTDGPGTWSITVQQGVCVPEGAAWITGTLMCEFIKACRKDDDCRLPRRVQTLTRQGVQLGGFLDTFESLPMLRTGIWEIDAWIEQGRFAGAATPSIISPELTRQTEQTWPRVGDCVGS